jgi:signal transduction histidine kinase
MTTDARRRWRDWSAGDRLGAGYVLLAIAELVVLALAWYGLAAIDRQQRTVQHNLRQFATFGAANFSYRASALVSNHSNMVAEHASRFARRETPELLAIQRAFTDSLMLCGCEAGLGVQALLVLNDSARVLGQSGAGRVVLPTRTLAGMYARVRQFSDPVLVVRMTDETGTPSVMALSRVGTVMGRDERFLLIAYEPDSIRSAYLDYIYQTRPPLLPSVYGWRSSNSSVIAVRVILPGGTVFWQSPMAPASGYSTPASFGPDTAVKITAALTPDAAIQVRGETVGAYARAMVVLMALIATLVIGLIAFVLRRATELAQLRGDFTAAVSHELRTPLTEIMLYAELIESGRTASGTATTDAAQVILAESRRLHNLVENVLVVARTDRRMLRVRVTENDLVPIVRATVATFAPLATKREIPVHCELPASLMARCDPGAVSCVMLNLLDNAVRYGPKSQAVIVRGRQVGPGQVSLEVDDAGPGIPATERERVTQPYVRLERDVDTLTSGSGLGLAVVSALLTEMQGTLRFEDSSRGGTIATALLAAT